LFFYEYEEFEIRNGIIVMNLNGISATKLSGTQILVVINEVKKIRKAIHNNEWWFINDVIQAYIRDYMPLNKFE